MLLCRVGVKMCLLLPAIIHVFEGICPSPARQPRHICPSPLHQFLYKIFMP